MVRVGTIILWGFIIIILFIAYKKADKTVKMMDEVSNQQKMEENDPEKDV